MTSSPLPGLLSRRTVLRGGAAGAAALGALAVAGPASAAAVSQNGWPVSSDPGSLGVVDVPLSGTGTSVALVGGEVAVVLGRVAQRFLTEVEGPRLIGGYSYRSIGGGSVWSNHASGTAFDVNWEQHAYGATGTFSSAELAVIRDILAECQGAVRWGGDYRGTKDEMHFEINVAPGDATLARVAAAFSGATTYAAPAPAAAPALVQRLGVIDGDGRFSVKEGGLTAGWVHQSDDVARASLAGDRIALVDRWGGAWAKQGGLSAAGVYVAGGVQDVAVTGDRLAVVTGDGQLIVKDGDLRGDWVTVVDRRATAVELDGDRIAVLTDDGVCSVKDGLRGSFVEVAGGVSRFAISGSRVGVISGGAAMVKEGSLHSGWTTVATYADRLALSGDRIGVLSGGDLYVKDGVYGSWTHQAGSSGDLALAGDRIGVVADGTASVKSGGLRASWVVEAGARQVLLSEG